MTDEPTYNEQVEAQRKMQAELQGQEAAAEWQANHFQKRVQNPEFYDKVTDAGVDSEKYDWISDELGPLFAEANFIANRDPSYEREAKWLNQNRIERKLAMHNPGRLCKGPVRKIAQRVHGRPDKNEREPMLQDDRQALRLGSLAATNYHSLALENTGLRAVSEATTVNKHEEHDSSRAAQSSRKILGN